jgi:hypothetical protein
LLQLLIAIIQLVCMSSRRDSIWLSTEGFFGATAFLVAVRLRVVEEVLVVPFAVVCASPADSAETSASVASAFSWFFIGPLSFCLVIAVRSPCLRAEKDPRKRLFPFSYGKNPEGRADQFAL